MLTEQLTADAAALHQAILDHGGEVSPFFCGKELGWEHRRIARAMEELVAAGIMDPAAAVLPKPLKQRKTYDFPEIQAILADFPAFARAVHAVEHAAGRRLPTADLSALTELFDFHGLSPEALELLTAQCCDEAILRGEERPTARRIEKLGLEWARLGVRSRADAMAAIRRMAGGNRWWRRSAVGCGWPRTRGSRRMMPTSPRGWTGASPRRSSSWPSTAPC